MGTDSMLYISSKLRSPCHVIMSPRQHLMIIINTVVPPSAEIEGPTEDIVAGSLVRFRCHVTQGTEPISIDWHYENESGLPVGAEKDNDVLTFADVQPRHSGTYICNITNPWGFIERSATLTVQGEPSCMKYCIVGSVI